MKKAFTTIELIVMLTLLSVMLVLIVPNFLTYLDNSASSEYEATKEVIEKAADLYVDDHGGFSNSGSSILLTTLTSGGYLPTKTLEVLDKYVKNGYADTSSYFTQVCINPADETVNYDIAATSCS